MKKPLCAALLFLLAACNHGMRPARFPPAAGPAGAFAAIRIVGESADRVGELYTADTAGVVMRVDRLIRIPWRMVHALDIQNLGRGYDVLPNAPPDSVQLAAIAAVSRFPQGLSGQTLRDVLSALKQDAVEGPGAHDDAPEETRTAELDSVTAIAAVASARFRDRRVAMAEGYRRVGADFPGMGEHWVNPAALLSDALDPRRPSFLTYARVRGEPRLLGLGFITTTTGEAVPTSLPGWPRHWHEHSGLLAEESGARVGHRPAATGTRVWVLHVWTELPNPDGRYTADNWSLAYARANVSPPAIANPSAARAFGLAGDAAEDDFLLTLLTDSQLRTTRNAARVDSIVASARARSAALVRDGSGRVDAALVDALAAEWSAMTVALEWVAGQAVLALLEPSHRNDLPKRGPFGHAH